LEAVLSKTLKYIFVILVVIVVALGSFAGGFITGHIVPLTSIPGLPGPITIVAPTVSPEQQSATPSELQALFSPFWEAWNLVHDNYVDQPVDNIALMRGAISGMMNALGDQHSSYMDPKDFADANSSLAGEYEGIGAFVDTTAEYLTITSPIPGSPAERAGLLPGDQVVAIDGEDMTGINAEVARTKVLGPANTVVHLTIFREGQEKLLEFDVTREKITMKSATGKMLKNDIAYIQVTTFGDKTTPELLTALKELMAQNPKGIVLDLRNNGGGYLKTAVEVASQFIGDGVVLYEQYGDDTRTTYDVLPGGMATDIKIPMVVLINEGSASASEIVAGALQDTGRAKLVGVTSYGKGSVQNWIPLGGDNGAVRITIAKWLTPKEHTIHKIGLTPDIAVERTGEDFKAKRDPQLDVAVEYLSHTISGTPYVYEAPPALSLTEPAPAEAVPAEPVPTDPMPADVECPLAMPAHLTSGQSAAVTNYLYLRSSPGIGSNWIQTINPKTQVEVVGSPTCVPHRNGAYIWWQVKLPDGTMGWLAEGSFTRKAYFLEPVK
jgi:carboxyl-terminal processing protease